MVRKPVLLGGCLTIIVGFVAVIVGLAWSMWPVLCCRVINPDSNEALQSRISDSNRCKVGDDLGADLRTKGFTVIRNFLNEEERKTMVEIHKHMKTTVYHPAYRHPTDEQKKMYPRKTEDVLRELLPRLENNSGVKVTGHDGGIENTFTAEEFLTASAFDDRMVNYNWHSDFEGYYISQSTTDYFNIYMFIEKPIKDDAGVSFVPWDSLKAVSRETHDKAISSGAVTAFYIPARGDFGFELHGDPKTDEIYNLNFSLDDIGCTPDMNAGDLVVFRGDTLHRTQTPKNSTRISWSLRICNDNFSVMRALSGGMMKYQRMRFMGDGLVWRSLIAKFGRKPLSEYTGLEKFQAWVISNFIRAYLELGFWYRVYLLEVRHKIGHLLGEFMFPVSSGFFQGFYR